MPTIRLPPHLKQTLDAKPLPMRKAILGCLVKLQENPRRKGTKKMQGTRNVFESRASQSDRVTWKYDGEVVVILNHCNHDILQRPYG